MARARTPRRKVEISRRKLSPPQVAQLWGVDVQKVWAWIRNGELRAIDASTKQGERHRWLVDLDDLAAFERARAIVPEVKPARRKKPAPAVTEFFPEK